MVQILELSDLPQIRQSLTELVKCRSLICLEVVPSLKNLIRA